MNTIKSCILAISIISIITVTGYTAYAATGSYYGEPTSIAQDIVANDVHTYAFIVPPSADTFNAALTINEVGLKHTFSLSLIDPFLNTTNCVTTPANFKMVVDECQIADPINGYWGISVTTNSFNTTATHAGYTIIADTKVDLP